MLIGFGGRLPFAFYRLSVTARFNVSAGSTSCEPFLSIDAIVFQRWN